MVSKIIPFVSILLCLASFASPRLTTDSLSSLIKAYTLATKPTINPNFKITVTEYNVEALWDSMGIQVVDAVFRSLDGTWFNTQEYLYRNGTIIPFADAFGGWGVMSGAVLDRKFYYTYSWGSGIHRSHVGYLYIDHDSLVFHETGGYINTDLFVSKSPSDSIYICTGAYKGFNSWTTTKDCTWRAIINGESQLIIVDSTGKEVEPAFPSQWAYTRAITVSKDSILVYNNSLSSFADGVIFTNQVSADIHFDSGFVLVEELDTIGYGRNGFEASWKSNSSSSSLFAWSMAPAGPTAFRLVKKAFLPPTAQPLTFSGKGSTDQIFFLEIGYCFQCALFPKYPRHISGKMKLYFSNGQVVTLRLISNDSGTPVLRGKAVPTVADIGKMPGGNYRYMANGRRVGNGNWAQYKKFKAMVSYRPDNKN